MTITVIRGGEIVDQNGRRRSDVAVDDESGRIAAIGTAEAPAELGRAVPNDATVLDATDCLVTPGFVDLNVHTRQPGDEAAETVDSAARAAALGGFTAIVAMADTEPCVDSAPVVAEIQALAKGASCEVVPAAALTVGREGEALVPFGELLDAGVRIFTDAARSIDHAGLLRRAMEYLGGVAEISGCRPVIADRPDLTSLTAEGVMNEGEWSSKLGLAGRPAVAEELAVARDLAIARLASTPLHLQQLSTAGSVALLRAAKAEGQAVTAEVSVHHLVLDETACATFDPNTKLLPPLRTAADVEALVAAVAEGTVDAISSAHAPTTVDAKEQPFDSAPFGAIGLETTLGVLLTDVDLPIEKLLPALSWQPAAIAGLDNHGGPVEVGRSANLTVIDPARRWRVDPMGMASRATNTPFAGRNLMGKVRHTMLDGRPTVVGGALR